MLCLGWTAVYTLLRTSQLLYMYTQFVAFDATDRYLAYGQLQICCYHVAVAVPSLTCPRCPDGFARRYIVVVRHQTAVIPY